MMVCPQWFEFDAGPPVSAGGHSETHPCTKVRQQVTPPMPSPPMPNENAEQQRPALMTLLRFELPPAHRLHSAEPVRPPTPGNRGSPQDVLRNSRARARRASVPHMPPEFPRRDNSRCPA